MKETKYVNEKVVSIITGRRSLALEMIGIGGRGSRIAALGGLSAMISAMFTISCRNGKSKPKRSD